MAFYFPYIRFRWEASTRPKKKLVDTYKVDPGSSYNLGGSKAFSL